MDNLALAADRVIVSLGDFGVAAYSVANGTEMWRRSDFISLGGPRLDCGVVWVGATDRPNWNGPEREVLLGMTGRLLALDPATGATVRAGPTTRPPGAPIMVGELLVSGDDSGTVRAYRRLDGSLAWAWSPGTPPVFWNQPRLASDGTHVVVARRSTEVGDSYEELVVLRASDGVAERTLGKWFPFGAPVIAYGMVFAETGPVRRTIAWDIATGEPRWVADGAGWPAVAFDGMLLFGSYEGEVRLLDARTGLFVELLSGGGFMSAIVSCGRIYGGFREADGTPGVWALGDPGASGCPRSEVF
jgi:outer membrane protein assembly factor BamB